MLRFGVSRSHEGSRLFEGSRRFTAILKERLSVPVRVVVAYNYDDLLELLLDRSLDLAWVPPLVHAQAVDGGAEPAAVCQRAGAPAYRAALIVAVDSPVTSLATLHQVRAAWSDPQSASGYHFPRQHLAAAGLDLTTVIASERSYETQKAACAAVAAGQADLCACHVSAVARDPMAGHAEMRKFLGPLADRLRVLEITMPIPSDGLVMRAGLDPELATRLREALCTMHESADGLDALELLMQAERLLPTSEDITRMFARLKSHLPRPTADRS
jgi:phosphonate transport system substrate-binding protein